MLLSLWECLQRLGLAIWHCGARTVHDHRQKSVITVNAEHVDHAMFAKAFQCTFISGIGNALIDMEFRAEVINNLLILAHTHGISAISNRVHNLCPDA